MDSNDFLFTKHRGKASLITGTAVLTEGELES